MINSKRIVPTAATSLLDIYSVFVKGQVTAASSTVTKLSATDPGNFTIASASGNYFADEPVKSLEITAGTSAVVYFVPALDFKGFTIAGSPVTTTGVDVDPDGATLYTATLSGGNAIAIAKAGL